MRCPSLFSSCTAFIVSLSGIGALQITSPSSDTIWDLSKNQTIIWTANATDPSQFALQLVNYAAAQAPVGAYRIMENIGYVNTSAASEVVSTSVFITFNDQFVIRGAANWTIGFKKLDGLDLYDQSPPFRLTDSTNPWRFDIPTSAFIVPTASQTLHATLATTTAANSTSGHHKTPLSTDASVGIGIVGFALLGLAVAVVLMCFRYRRRGNWRKENGEGAKNLIWKPLKSHEDVGNTKESQKQNAMRGAYAEIAFYFLAIICPILALPASLLGIIFSKQINQDPLASAIFDPPASLGSDAYYVAIDTSKLMAISSWTSTIALLVPGMLMVLFSSGMASMVQRSSEKIQLSSLPTPYQFTLLLDLIKGGLSSIWATAKYLSWKRREKSVKILNLAFGLLLVANLLGYGILACDTWLHVTSDTVVLSRLGPSNRDNVQNYSRVLPASCSVTGSEDWCLLQLEQGVPLFANQSEYVKTLNNDSSINQIQSTAISGRRSSFLAPVSTSVDLDYQATTLASQTQCQFISSKCGLSSPDLSFNCSSIFAGTSLPLSYNGTTFHNNGSIYPILVTESNGNGLTLFFTSSLNGSTPYTLGQNPYYFYAAISGTGSRTRISAGIPGEQIVGATTHSGYGMILQCQSALQNLTYTVQNSTIIATDASLITNTALATSMMTGLTQGLLYDGLTSSTVRATFGNTYIPDAFSTYYDTVLLASIASASDAAPNLAQRSRITVLAARIPKAPLFTLITFLLLLALVCIVVTVMAVARKPQMHRDVQQRLSTEGVVSSLFVPQLAGIRASKIEELFGERFGEGSRVGIVKTVAGGVVLESWKGEEVVAAATGSNGKVPLVPRRPVGAPPGSGWRSRQEEDPGMSR